MSYPGGIPADSAVINGAQPIHLAGDSRLPAILLLHGYTGYAGDMRFLATRLNEAGYSVVVPRYPGHGTNSRDFRSTTWRDWLRRATDAYLELAGPSRTDHCGRVVNGRGDLIDHRRTISGGTALSPRPGTAGHKPPRPFHADPSVSRATPAGCGAGIVR
jgi:hypothetical protein